MVNKLSKWSELIRDQRNAVETDMRPYSTIVTEIQRVQLQSLTDSQLQAMSRELRAQAENNNQVDQLLVEAFALVSEVSYRRLGLRPFAEQVMAGIALHRGKMVEMQTGEGKTLAAVMPAYLNALTGRGVHVLTFNDYLARRDAQWMGPIYQFLGLSVSAVSEGMGTKERQRAYAADITYLTAKESGFDYLRDFLCNDKDLLVHRPFHYAIVDEADSILIDEARIPLVIAGSLPYEGERAVQLANVVRQLTPGADYEVEQYGRNIYLTEDGLSKVERLLGFGNLYEHEELLARVNCALHAEALLTRDKDYIVRDGRIELVDEFTGRVAEKRHWPDNLQAAVEAKEGLVSSSRGMVMGSITLQHLLRLYPRLCGMTGTARTAAAELNDLYGLQVVVIPTHQPVIRQDHPDLIFTHMEAKLWALIAEVKRAHSNGQPVLIGTGSVEESEQLAAQLMAEGVRCRVLNAKNDDMEAQIISRAGEPGAVTVSTNMAGRGVDIKLGGEKESDRRQVVAAGGLYVIGTNRHESVRVDNQLRGRAGRQGDPGESRFFICFEDDLIKRFEVVKLIPTQHRPTRQDSPITDPVVAREIDRGQRIVEGYTSDTRRQMLRYSNMIEQQRRIIHERRRDILLDKKPLDLLSTKDSERYSTLCRALGEATLLKAEKQLTLYTISKCWADYLDYMSYIREGIHLVVVGRQNPLDEFHRLAIEEFARMMERIDDEILNAFGRVEIGPDGIDMDGAGMKGPSSTWTYLVNESPDQFSNLPYLLKTMSTAIKGPLYSAKALYQRLFNKKP